MKYQREDKNPNKRNNQKLSLLREIQTIKRNQLWLIQVPKSNKKLKIRNLKQMTKKKLNLVNNNHLLGRTTLQIRNMKVLMSKKKKRRIQGTKNKISKRNYQNPKKLLKSFLKRKNKISKRRKRSKIRKIKRKKRNMRRKRKGWKKKSKKSLKKNKKERNKDKKN